MKVVPGMGQSIQHCWTDFEIKECVRSVDNVAMIAQKVLGFTETREKKRWGRVVVTCGGPAAVNEWNKVEVGKGMNRAFLSSKGRREVMNKAKQSSTGQHRNVNEGGESTKKERKR